MPRRTPRPPGPDDWAAQRVRRERELRDWSTGELARRVTDAGAAIRQQAIWEIENREPPRKISYGEALAFCKVFEIEDVSELGKPREEIGNPELTQLRQEVAEIREAHQQLLDNLRHALARERVLLAETTLPEDLLGSYLVAATVLASFGADVHEILREEGIEIPGEDGS